MTPGSDIYEARNVYGVFESRSMQGALRGLAAASGRRYDDFHTEQTSWGWNVFTQEGVFATVAIATEPE